MKYQTVERALRRRHHRAGGVRTSEVDAEVEHVLAASGSANKLVAPARSQEDQRPSRLDGSACDVDGRRGKSPST